LFLLLDAQFIGFAQILVYVGAVAILIVFAILLTRGTKSTSQSIVSSSWFVSSVVAATVFGVLAWTIRTSVTSQHQPPPQLEVSVKQIGDALMSRFALPLEVIGLLLTAALVGAVTVAMRDKQEMK
jgi:NADH-quinone oxidoreductase subunit J